MLGWRRLGDLNQLRDGPMSNWLAVRGVDVIVGWLGSILSLMHCNVTVAS
ncbi:MAG: hypothetical protein ABL898_14775 [Hyphomicrobiaceae bacterium]